MRPAIARRAKGTPDSLSVDGGALAGADVTSVCRILDSAGKLRRNSIALELGAGHGATTIELARSGVFSSVLAIEPEPGNFRSLAGIVTQSGFERVVQCVPCAAGMVDGMVNFHVNRMDSRKSSIKQKNESDVRLRTPISRIDTILQDAGIGPARLGLIWMDIEGYEIMACLGMTPLMEASVPMHIVFSPSPDRPRQAQSFLRLLECYYHRCVVFDGMGPQLTPISTIPIDQAGLRFLLID